MQSVYLMKSGDCYKIGIAENPEERRETLALGNPNIRLLYASEPVSNAREIELKLHEFFSSYSIGREWFESIDASSCINKIKEFIKNYGKFEKEEYEFKELYITDLQTGKRESFTDALNRIREETEEIREENEMLWKAFDLIMSNQNFRKVARGLFGLNWSIEDISMFIIDLQESMDARSNK